MAKCEYCGSTITITRNKLMPMWDLKCACLSTSHAHLEYGLRSHGQQAGKALDQVDQIEQPPTRCTGATMEDGSPIVYGPGVEPPECNR